MGDKGQKDKNKHNKQVSEAKNKKNEAKIKKQQKAHQQKKGQNKSCLQAELAPRCSEQSLTHNVFMKAP